MAFSDVEGIMDEVLKYPVNWRLWWFLGTGPPTTHVEQAASSRSLENMAILKACYD